MTKHTHQDHVMSKPMRAEVASLLTLLLILPFASAVAQELNSVVALQDRINQDAASSQARVSQLADQTADLLAEYRTVVRTSESLKVYNEQLQRVVEDQRAEVTSINEQLDGLEDTNRGIVPLMLDMVETLGKIVESDLPFRLEERQARVQRLRDMLDQADVTTSEKYRRILEAYEGELEYGRTTEVYSGSLPTTDQTVDFLRVGRTVLIYQSSDAAVTGWFNRDTRQFESLPDHYRLEVKKGLSIARNERAPDLVVLPVPGPELAP